MKRHRFQKYFNIFVTGVVKFDENIGKLIIGSSGIFEYLITGGEDREMFGNSSFDIQY